MLGIHTLMYPINTEPTAQRLRRLGHTAITVTLSYMSKTTARISLEGDINRAVLTAHEASRQLIIASCSATF